ncbi:MAG: hypothetical protein RR330_00490 [Alistipes sp.]
MIKHTSFLIILCLIGLVLTFLCTIYCAMRGYFQYMAIGGAICLLLFAIFIVLRKERHVAQIMGTDNYNDPFNEDKQ